MQVVEYEGWKDELLARIEEGASTTEKGDLFVQAILRDRYQLSEDDAVNATDCAGPGDRGVDAIHIVEAEGDLPPRALVLQGKYGGAFSPYEEFSKFQRALAAARAGNAPTQAIAQCAAVLNAGGVLQYVAATVDVLPSGLIEQLDDVRVLARNNFEDRIAVEAICLRDVYREIVGERLPARSVTLACKGVRVRDDVFVGTASLTDVYQMLREYTQGHNGVLDTIYDRNVRKWLGNRGRSVNVGIAETLRSEPEKFIAYNNGITMVCLGFDAGVGVLSIDSPQIVNGCQTTRTLYDFMESHFAGVRDQLGQRAEAEPYRRALLPFKLIAVTSLDDDLLKNITRYSNRQNAVRGRDFLTLEDDFQRLKVELRERGYFLEVQTGEYRVLPKAERERFPLDRLINAFDALRFYGAGVLGHPHTAFGRSGDFTPGGREFDEIMEGLTSDDLLVPWIIAKHAEQKGYSVGARWHATAEDHRNQTRYFFLYCFFRIAAQLVRGTPTLDHGTRHSLYDDLLRMREHSLASPDGDSPFRDILKIADTVVLTYMTLAQSENWYVDRNAFLKREDLLDEVRFLLTSTPALLEKDKLCKQIQAVLES